MAKANDKQTQALLAEVNRRKLEIAQIERPNWITSCSFSYGYGSPINIHVESSIMNLVSIIAFLRDKEESYKRTVEELKISAPPFTWAGFNVSDWVHDLTCRINKIQVSTKRKILDELEARLNAVISPELRLEMELKAVSEALKNE